MEPGAHAMEESEVRLPAIGRGEACATAFSTGPDPSSEGSGEAESFRPRRGMGQGRFLVCFGADEPLSIEILKKAARAAFFGLVKRSCRGGYYWDPTCINTRY
jgi:hypothetical protein